MQNQKYKQVLLILSGQESGLRRRVLIAESLGISRKLSMELDVLIPQALESLLSHQLMKQVSRVQGQAHTRIQLKWIRSDQYLDQVFKSVQEHKPYLIIIDRSQILSAIEVGMLTSDQSAWKCFISQVRAPILIMSQRKNVSTSESILVPMSGEMRKSQALEWSIGFANLVDLPLDLIHVTSRASAEQDRTLDLSLLGRGCDEFHHEYPSLVSEFLAQASPYSTLRDKRVIRTFVHCSGPELSEILRFGSASKHPFVVIEWKGNLGFGRSQVMRGILQSTDWPVVLIREKS